MLSVNMSETKKCDDDVDAILEYLAMSTIIHNVCTCERLRTCVWFDSEQMCRFDKKKREKRDVNILMDFKSDNNNNKPHTQHIQQITSIIK